MDSAATRGSSARSRRRSPAGDPLKKTTVQMHTSTIEAVRKAVEHGAASSQNEFVEEAVLSRLRGIRRAKVYASYLEAASDAAFVEDMRETSADFDAALQDGLPEGEP